jgi:hypothetical protein
MRCTSSQSPVLGANKFWSIGRHPANGRGQLRSVRRRLWATTCAAMRPLTRLDGSAKMRDVPGYLNHQCERPRSCRGALRAFSASIKREDRVSGRTGSVPPLRYRPIRPSDARPYLVSLALRSGGQWRTGGQDRRTGSVPPLRYRPIRPSDARPYLVSLALLRRPDPVTVKAETVSQWGH